MQKKDRNKNLLRSNARNQRQQIKPRRDVEDRRVSDQIQRKHAIEDGGHLFLLHVAVGGGSSFLRTAAVLTRV